MSAHKDYEEILALAALGAATEAEVRALELHLGDGCRECERRLLAYRSVAGELVGLLEHRRPSAGARERLRGHVAGCEHAECEALAALGGLSGLTGEEEVGIADHARECPRCRNRLHSPVAAALAGLIESREPSAAATSRIKQAVRASAQAATARAQVPLVGRHEEKKAIGQALRALGRGEGSVIVVEGEAGVGKSRLVEECLAGASGVEVWRGRAVAVEGTEGYGPIVDMLEQWAAAWGRPEDTSKAKALERAVLETMGSEGREVVEFLARVSRARFEPTQPGAGSVVERQIRASLRRLIEVAAKRRPLVLVFEDLHWADESTLAVLESLLPVVESCPAVIIAITRAASGKRASRIAEMAERVVGLRSRRVRLGGLAEREALVLARRLVGRSALPPRLARSVRECGGNPLFIEELVRAARVASAPGETGAAGLDLGRLIGTRVECLEPRAREVLEAAAVAGRRFHRAVVEQVVGRRGDVGETLGQLERLGFLRSTLSRETGHRRVRTLQPQEVWEFRHALLREAVRARIPVERRRQLHARCAAAIEEVFAGRLHDFHGLLAYQYLEAGDIERAHARLMDAGETAASAAASAEALAFFRRAYDLYRQAGLRRDLASEVRLERNLGLALLSAGQLSESIEHFNAALRLLGEWVPASRLALWAKAASDVVAIAARLYSGRLGCARAASARERALFELMYNRCRAQNVVGDPRRVYDNLAAIRHVGHLDLASVDHAIGIVAAAGAFFAFAGISFDPSWRFLRISERLAEKGTPEDRFLHRAMSFVVHYLAGDWSPEHDVEDELVERGIRAGFLWDADVYLGMAAERAVARGNYDEAIALRERIAALRTEWGYEFSRSNELAVTAMLELERRRLDAARAAASCWYDLRDEAPMRVFALGLLAKAETLDGNLDRAEEALEHARILIERGGSYPYYQGVYLKARLALDVAWIERARQASRVPAGLARRARRNARRALASARKVARDRGEIWRLVARLEWLLDRPARAAAWWRRAVDECERLGLVPELGRAWLDAAAAWQDAPTEAAAWWPEGASACLRNAAAAFEAVGNDRELALVLEARRRVRAA